MKFNLRKNKMDLNNQKNKNHPSSPVVLFNKLFMAKFIARSFLGRPVINIIL